MPFNNTFNSLIKQLKKEASGLQVVKVALLADFAAQYLTKALKGAAVAEGYQLEIWEADYDAIDSYIFNTQSDLYTAQFSFILLFYSPLKLYKSYSKDEHKTIFWEQKLHHFKDSINQLQQDSSARILLANLPEFDDGLFGNFANKTASSFVYQLRKLNIGFMEMAMTTKNLFVTDLQALSSRVGSENTYDGKLYVHGDIIYTLDFMAETAVSSMKVIAAALGRFKKCVIIDLDNTMWGGIIGDDGVENIQIGDLGIGKAFTSFQVWLKNLKERGIILAVCSKNTDSIAREPFEKHPSMVLKMDDISVFVANWETKVDNITFIQSVLNIGYDSMVFLDDNPFERNMVRENLPAVTVPELPEDPADYLNYLQSLNLFETASFTEADASRTKQYQEEAGRAVLQKTFASEDSFLESLQMIADVTSINKFTLPRVAQLTQRSNQFNLRTIRYTDDEVQKVMDADDKFSITIDLKDKFGSYGLITAVILNKLSDDTLFIDTWIMSCRVLKRGVEAFLLNEIVQLALNNKIRYIIGEYIPTAKNALVKDHYQQLGFQLNGTSGKWALDTMQYNKKEVFIAKTNTYAIN